MAKKQNRADSNGKWQLRLYVAGKSPRSLAAMRNLLAKEHQIVAIPTLIRNLPEPLRKIVGDLSNTERALVGLQLGRIQ